MFKKNVKQREVKLLLLNIFHSCQHLWMLPTISVHTQTNEDAFMVYGWNVNRDSSQITKITNHLQDFTKRI